MNSERYKLIKRLEINCFGLPYRSFALKQYLVFRQFNFKPQRFFCGLDYNVNEFVTKVNLGECCLYEVSLMVKVQKI